VDSTQWLVRAVPYDCYSRFALYQVRNIVPNTHTHTHTHTHQSILVTHTQTIPSTLLLLLLLSLGPDHLAALLPRCCGQRWFKAGRVGALWGMGHGVSATLLGVCAFALKNTFQRNASVRAAFSTASHVTEIAVGLSLILIGLMGLREAREWEDSCESSNTTSAAKSLSSAAVEAEPVKTEQNRAVILNGLLHGFSWDGAPSLAPAIAVATWSGNLAFLSAYAVGTMTAMAIVTTLVGEGTRRAGQVFNRPDIPQKLSYASSILAITIGVIWCGLGVAP